MLVSKKFIATLSTGVAIGFAIALANAEEPTDSSNACISGDTAGDTAVAPGESGMDRPAESKCSPRTPRTQSDNRSVERQREQAGKVPPGYAATPKPKDTDSVEGNDPLHPEYPY